MLTFTKEERLCGEKLIEKLFHNGSSFVLYPFRILLLPDTFEGPQVRTLISVPKRRFKRAVDRNLLKRRIREAYRLHKGTELYPQLAEINTQLLLGIMYIGKDIADFALIEKKICVAFQKIVSFDHAPAT